MVLHLTYILNHGITVIANILLGSLLNLLIGKPEGNRQLKKSIETRADFHH